MDPALARPFITATKDVLSAMADLDVVAGTPYVKKNNVACGLVSAMIGITGDRQGAFCVSFERDTAVHIVTQMLGEAIEDLTRCAGRHGRDHEHDLRTCAGRAG